MTPAKNDKELELQRWALMVRLGTEARLYRDIKLLLPRGVLTQLSVKGDLIMSSSGLQFIPRSEIVNTGLIDLLLGILGPVGFLLEAILAWTAEHDAGTRRRTATDAYGTSAADSTGLLIPYESIHRIRSFFGTLYIKTPRGTYLFYGRIPSAADLRGQIAARVGAGHLR